MIVVALAGHVDHGKTALVRALTGIDTDRLREEKERGMTTDLGFASLDLPPQEAGPGVSLRPGRRVGLVDVPGHERYIRNMASGAWGADLCFLCVAADDGWMDQTENHCRLLSACAPPRALVIVTKADLADENRVREVGEDAFRRASLILGKAAVAAGYVATSTKTGQGLADLAELAARECDSILRARFSPPAVSRAEGAFLFVDRIFSRKGTGLVVCGTLRGGAVRVEEELVLYPQVESLRIKGAESLGSSVILAEPGCRLALNTTRTKAEIRRGDLLCAPGRMPLQAAEFVVRVEETARSAERREKGERALVRGGEAELVAGSANRTVKLESLGKGGFCRLVCDKTLAVPRELRAALVRSGGAELLGAVSFVHAGECGKEGRRRARETADAVASADRRFAALAVATAIDGATALGPILPAFLPDAKALDSYGFIVVAGHLVDKRSAVPSCREVGETSGKRGGKSVRFPPSVELPQEVVLALAGQAAAAEKAKRPEETAPSPAARAAERALRTSGITGIEPNAAPERGKPPPPQRRLLEELCAAGTAVPLDRDLFWHAETYQRAAASVLFGLESGTRFTIADAKVRAGLSRKYAIPFLNRLERDGWVKRDGENRVLVKRWLKNPKVTDKE